MSFSKGEKKFQTAEFFFTKERENFVHFSNLSFLLSQLFYFLSNMTSFLPPHVISLNHGIELEKAKQRELAAAEKWLKEQIQSVLSQYDSKKEYKPNKKLLILDINNIYSNNEYSVARDNVIKELKIAGWNVYQTTVLRTDHYRQHFGKYTRWYFVPKKVEFSAKTINELKELPFNKDNYNNYYNDYQLEINYIGGFEEYCYTDTKEGMELKRLFEKHEKEQKEKQAVVNTESSDSEEEDKKEKEEKEKEKKKREEKKKRKRNLSYDSYSSDSEEYLEPQNAEEEEEQQKENIIKNALKNKKKKIYVTNNYFFPEDKEEEVEEEN